jgi:DNA-binding Lrp family transcriptional regulator
MDTFEKFRMMLDQYSSQILNLTSPQAMNALELSDALGIPIAACYRRIRALKEAGILHEEGKVVSIGGKLVASYRSSVESAEVHLTDGRLRVVIKTADERDSEEMPLSDEASLLHWAASGNEEKE